jgi:hypothetical protein
MLEHLLVANPADFLSLEEATPNEVLSAQYATTKALEELGVLPDDEIERKTYEDTAKNAFLAMTAHLPAHEQKHALAKLEVPDAVKELVGMLTAYDWAFVEQAKELRGYAVAKITEETVHPDARIRLKALELLGKVTEVALFTDRSEVKQVGMSDKELDQELKTRLEKYIQLEKAVEGETLEGEQSESG